MPMLFSLFSLFFTIVSQSLMDLFGTIFILTLIYRKYQDNDFKYSFKEVLKSKYFLFFFFWVVWILVSFLIGASTYEHLMERVLEFRWILYVFCFFYLVPDIKEKHFRYLVFALALMCASSWYVYFTGIDYLTGVPREPSYYRAGGFLNDPMCFAHGLGLFLMFFLGYFSRIKMLMNKMVLFSLVILLVGLLLTITRGVWIAVIFSMSVFLLLKNWRYIFAFAVALSVMVCVGYWASKPFRLRADQTLSFDKSYDSERLVLWQANWYIFKNNPVFGIGYGENKHRIREFYDILKVPAGQFEGNAHNQYINFLSGTGAVGLALYLIWIGINLYWAFDLSRNKQASLQEQALGFGSFLGQLVIVVGGLTESNFEHSKLKTIFALFWAISFYGYYLRKIKPYQKES